MPPACEQCGRALQPNARVNTHGVYSSADGRAALACSPQCAERVLPVGVIVTDGVQLAVGRTYIQGDAPNEWLPASPGVVELLRATRVRGARDSGPAVYALGPRVFAGGATGFAGVADDAATVWYVKYDRYDVARRIWVQSAPDARPPRHDGAGRDLMLTVDPNRRFRRF